MALDDMKEMNVQDIDMAIPAFLRRQKNDAPRRKFSTRWKRLPKPTPPDGAVWEGAERWEVTIPERIPKLAVGTRLVWAVPGSKWCRLADGGAKAKIGMREWNELSRNGRRVA